MIEILSKDLLGRITRFKTKSGIIETPAFLPVVHPTRVLIPPRLIYEKFNCSTIITNAYLLLKAKKAGEIHKLLDFPGSIMTDSGAYQLLIYGQVHVSPIEIIEFQEQIKSDIAVILDVPTGGHSTYEQAQKTVEETVRRAFESTFHRSKSKILWVGPIQGGTYPALVAKSAQQIAQLDFSIYAIGSPTQLMEQYQFSKLVDLVMAAKRNLPTHKPVHLFGAGHPLVFPLLVAMGCDMFDSAAYAIFARHDRLLTPDGTIRLEEVKEQFCHCPTCNKYSIAEVKQLEDSERIRILAEHNLHVCINEIARIKQAIYEGRLWRLVESRLSSHPALVDALNQLILHSQYIEEFSSVSKKRALFISSTWSLHQPEIIRHYSRITSYEPPDTNRDLLLLMAAPSFRPYDFSGEFKKINEILNTFFINRLNHFDVLFLSPYFGLVPLELSSLYPLAQHEIPSYTFPNWSQQVLKQLHQYVTRLSKYSHVIGIFPSDPQWKRFSRSCKRLLETEVNFCHCKETSFDVSALTKVIKRIAQMMNV